MKRVFVYIDGYNLYHAIKELGSDENHLKWVNLWSLAEKLTEEDEEIEAVKYFSAYLTEKDESYRRHQKYVAALEACGVEFIEGKFKKKPIKCRECQNTFWKPEEKETDVNIASHLVADGFKNRYERAIVISADTDLNGAIKLTRRETSKEIRLGAPPKRRKLNIEVDFEISANKVRQSLLPAEIQTKKGATIIRPEEYTPPSSA